MSQILQQESALSNVSTPIVSGKCAVQSNVIAFIRHLHDTRSQDLVATRRSGLLTRAYRRRSERKGLEAIFTSQKEGMKIEILTGAAGIMAGRFLSVFALFRADALRALGPWGRHHLISSLVWITWNILSDMRRWHNDLRDCTSRNQATGHISLPY